MIIIQKTHQIEIKVIKIQSFLVKKINSIKFAFVIFFAVKRATIKSFRKRRINVYAKKSVIFQSFEKRNVKIEHKLLISESYIFEFIQKIDLNLSSCFLKIHVVVIDDCDSIFMTNFEETQAKIFKKQLLKRF